jgi:hypothetical protein
MAKVKVTYGPAPESMLVTNVRPGDQWVSDKETVVIDQIDEYEHEMLHVPMIRLHGRITRGWGASNKRRTWVFNTDQRLEILRTK